MDPIKLFIIRADSDTFVSLKPDASAGYYARSYREDIARLRFNGEPATDTFDERWFRISREPTEVTRQIPTHETNVRYVLKEGYTESPKTPPVIQQENIDEFDEIRGLYDRVADQVPEVWEPRPFVLEVLADVDDAVIQKSDLPLRYALLDLVRVPSLLLPTRPCKLSSEEAYKVIRSHVKQHLDPKYAEVTSDYDFCFTVKKRIELLEPEPFTYDANWNPFGGGRRKKPKMVTDYRRHRTITVFEMAPKPYQSYPVIEPFVAENADDMTELVNGYLAELMSRINEPFSDCPHCSGTGVKS